MNQEKRNTVRAVQSYKQIGLNEMVYVNNKSMMLIT